MPRTCPRLLGDVHLLQHILEVALTGPGRRARRLTQGLEPSLTLDLWGREGGTQPSRMDEVRGSNWFFIWWGEG